MNNEEDGEGDIQRRAKNSGSDRLTHITAHRTKQDFQKYTLILAEQLQNIKGKGKKVLKTSQGMQQQL